MAKNLDIAGLAQASYDLWNGRKTKDVYLLMNNIAQFLAGASAVAKVNHTSFNALACFTAFKKIEHDLKQNKSPDKGDMISFLANAIPIVSAGYISQPPHLRKIGVVLAIEGLLYSNRNTIKKQVEKLIDGNSSIKQEFDKIKQYFNKVNTSSLEIQFTDIDNPSFAYKMLNSDKFFALNDEKKLHVLEYAYLKDSENTQNIQSSPQEIFSQYHDKALKEANEGLFERNQQQSQIKV